MEDGSEVPKRKDNVEAFIPGCSVDHMEGKKLDKSSKDLQLVDKFKFAVASWIVPFTQFKDILLYNILQRRKDVAFS